MMTGMGARRAALLGAILAVGIGAAAGLIVLANGDGPSGGIDRANPQELPPPRSSEYRSEPVSQERGYRFWPRSGRVTPVTAYRFDTGHCGLGFLADFDGSFWRPIDPDAGVPQDLLIDQDLGEMALVDFNRAIYRGSTGVEVELERIRGPVVTQPCR
jgi:hypothetical protein